jgi:UDP-arabinose 4-epimerase
MNILVTGGAGYIGSHVCKALAQAGYTPITYDNLVNGHHWAVQWGPLEVGDILDRKRLDEVFNKYNPTAVMHFAAYTNVGESAQDPGKYYRNNVTGTLALVETMRDHDIDKLIFSSTSAIYGIPETMLITEDHPQRPINVYGTSKLMIEEILRDYDRAYGLRSISLRYFNAAGADPDSKIGEAHKPETHLIPLILDVACGKKSKITIFGNDYETPDGTCIRDFIHVSDLANAHLLGLQALESDEQTAAYNLSNGQGFSVSEILEVIKQVTQKTISFEIGPRRIGDVARLVGDSSLAKIKLRWRPKYFELYEIISTAWKWHKDMVHLSK